MPYSYFQQSSKNKHVVIIGAGFGGLNAAKYLSKNKKISITLIDKKNHHLFQPLLYQLATGALNPSDIAQPIRYLLNSKKNVKVYLSELKGVSFENNRIQTSDFFLSYDYLILACGSQSSYFNHTEWAQWAPSLKNVEDADIIKNKILMNLEIAEKEYQNNEHKFSRLTFVVIGGGPTGVELAGAIYEMCHCSLRKEFRNIKVSDFKIYLIEASSRILSTFDSVLSEKAENDLKKMGIQILKSSPVLNVTADGVFTKSTFIASHCVIWAAGVKANDINQSLKVTLDPQGRVYVDKDLSLAQHKNVFVIGDQNHFTLSNGKALPSLASVAIQQGEFVAKIIFADINGEPRKAFEYNNKGQMATIGRNKAIVEMGRIKLAQWPAWIIWGFVHIYYLIGFKNRLFVFLQWVWLYFTNQRSSRVIENHNSQKSPN
jgi:NADH dehydrogenase